MNLGVLFACVSMYYVHAVPMETSGYQILWDMSYRLLCSAVWVQGIESQSSGRAKKCSEELLNRLSSPLSYQEK